jgi:hypothetical protein
MFSGFRFCRFFGIPLQITWISAKNTLKNDDNNMPAGMTQ